MVHITNFRKIIDAEIHMEDNITVIAGANNSGKTSLVELFNAVFGSQKPIQRGVQERVQEAPIESLNEAIDEISKTNGGQAGNIVIDIDVSEDAVSSLLRNIIHAKFQTGDYFLSESSQGQVLNCKIALPCVLSYQNPLLGSKFVVSRGSCCQEIRGNVLLHKALWPLA